MVGINADTQPCSRQIEEEMKCMLTVTTSPEAKQLKDRMKQAFKTCAPNIPEDCHAQKEAMHECGTEIFKSVDSDPEFQESKKVSGPAVDQCFVTNPPSVKKAFEDLFMAHHGPKHGKFHKRRHQKWGHKKNNTSSSAEKSGETSGEVSSSLEMDKGNNTSSSSSGSAERKHHRGRHQKCRHNRRHGRHHGPRNATSSSSSESNSRENNTSSSGSNSKGKGGSNSKGKGGSSSKQRSSGERRHEKPAQCRKTKEQMKCVRDEMKKLGSDATLVDTINTLMNQKRKCKQLVTWSCTAKCSKRQKCVFKATKPCRQVFMKKLGTCLQKKGFTLPPFMLKKAHLDILTTPLPVAH
jgi:hypothetical protein